MCKPIYDKSRSDAPLDPNGSRHRFSLLSAPATLYAYVNKRSWLRTTAQLLVVGLVTLGGVGIIRTPHGKLPVAKAQDTGGDPWVGTDIAPAGNMTLEDPTVGQWTNPPPPIQEGVTTPLNFQDPNFLSNQALSDQANQNIGPSTDGTTCYLDATSNCSTSKSSGSTSAIGGGSNPFVEYSATGLDRNEVLNDPPDTHGAVGKNYYVEIVNTTIRVYLRVTSPGSSFPDTLGNLIDTSLTTIFPDSIATGLTDPRVIYDRNTDQFIVSVEGFPLSSSVQYLYVGVSSASPNIVPFASNTFMTHRINVNTRPNSLFDYPSIGIDQNALIFTGNIYTGYSFSDGTTTGSAGAMLFSIPKARLYSISAPYNFGTPAYFTGLLSTLQPPIKLDSSPYTYVISAGYAGFDYPGRNALQLYRLSNTNLATPTLQTTQVSVPSYFSPRNAKQPTGTDPHTRQPKNQLLQTLDDRFQAQPTQVGNSLFAVRCGNSTSSRNTPVYPACEFYEIGLGTAPFYRPTLPQHILFRSSNTSDDFNPSLAADDNKNVYINWSATNTPSGQNASIWCTGRLATDPPNMLRRPTQQYQSSIPYLPHTDPRLPANVSRWGDYSFVTIDPLAPGRAWAVQEMVPLTNYGVPGYNLLYPNTYDWAVRYTAST